MIPDYINQSHLIKIINDAITEDIGEGDHSTLSVIPEGLEGEAYLISKEKGIIAGIVLAEIIFRTIDRDLDFQPFVADGDSIAPGDKIFLVKGSARSILSAERLVLNFIQRMSGIATHTNLLCSLIKDTHVKLLDTRKTTPNLRVIEKWAVLIGGGANHRIGLFDMIMLKDNHIDFAGGITGAVKATRAYLEKNNKDLKIEVETRNLEEVKEALDTNSVDIIMLDNMTIADMLSAVKIINKKCRTEASGNITETNIAEVARTGIDFISVGALTHHIKSLDLSLKTKI